MRIPEVQGAACVCILHHCNINISSVRPRTLSLPILPSVCSCYMRIPEVRGAACVCILHHRNINISSVRPRTLDCGNIQYQLDAGTRGFGMLRTPTPNFPPGAGIPWKKIPGAPVFVRYGLDTGTQHFGKFGSFSIPTPDTSVTSLVFQHRYPTVR